MSLFLYKPHVEGPKGAITSPDIVVDRVFVDGVVKPVNFLCSGTHQQIEDGETCRPAYAVTAIGGGALISPAVLVGEGRICVARMAWRLANLDEDYRISDPERSASRGTSASSRPDQCGRRLRRYAAARLSVAVYAPGSGIRSHPGRCRPWTQPYTPRHDCAGWRGSLGRSPAQTTVLGRTNDEGSAALHLI